MKFYLSIVSLFLMSLGTADAESLELTASPNQITSMGPEFSFETGELNIPTVIVDGETLYNIKMQLMNSENGMIFSLVEAISQPSFEDGFGEIENNMSKSEVKRFLGMPQNIDFNLDVRGLAYCSQPPLEVGSIYESWRYFVDRTVDESSGFVVWFAKVDGVSEEMVVVGKVDGFGCI